MSPSLPGILHTSLPSRLTQSLDSLCVRVVRAKFQESTPKFECLKHVALFPIQASKVAGCLDIARIYCKHRLVLSDCIVQPSKIFIPHSHIKMALRIEILNLIVSAMSSWYHKKCTHKVPPTQNISSKIVYVK